MKKKLVLTLCVVSSIVLMTFATPQETIKTETYTINSGIPAGALGVNYIERAQAYAQLGEWQNCLNDMNWLKVNDIKKYYYMDSGVETRIKAFLAMEQKDEAFKDLYETFLYTGNYTYLIRLKELMQQYPEFADYLDLNKRIDLIQKHKYRADNMLSQANYTGDIRGTENGWYMLQVVANMGFINKTKRYNFYNTWNEIANNRYETCQYHSDDITFNVSNSAKKMFMNNGGIDCSYVMSKEGIQESLKIAETAGEFSMQAFGYSSYTNYWKNFIGIWKKRLDNLESANNAQTGIVSKQDVKSDNVVNTEGKSEEDTTTLDAVQAVQEGIKTTTDMINNLDNGVRKLNSIKSGLRTLGF